MFVKWVKKGWENMDFRAIQTNVQGIGHYKRLQQSKLKVLLRMDLLWAVMQGCDIWLPRKFTASLWELNELVMSTSMITWHLIKFINSQVLLFEWTGGLSIFLIVDHGQNQLVFSFFNKDSYHFWYFCTQIYFLIRASN